MPHGIARWSSGRLSTAPIDGAGAFRCWLCCAWEKMGTKKPLLVRQGLEVLTLGGNHDNLNRDRFGLLRLLVGLGDAAGRELGLAGFGPERNLGVESKASAPLSAPRFVCFRYVDASVLVSARVGCFS